MGLLIACTSMIHAAAPYFLWSFAVAYAAHQINLQPRVSLPETTPTLRWTGKVGDASAFRVWGSRAFVRDTTADKLSSRAVPCVFLGFPPDAPGWQFYHPTSRHVLSSQDVTFDKSMSYFHPTEPVEVAVDSGAARGAETGGAESGGAENGGAESGGAETGRADPGGVAPKGTVSGGTEPWYSRRCWVAAGAAGAGAAGGTGGATGAPGGAGAAGGGAGAGAAGGAAGAGATGGAAGARAAGGAAGAGAAGGAAGAAGGAAGTGGPGAEGTGSVSVVSRGAARPRPYYVLLLQQVLGSPPSPRPPPPFLSPPPVQSQLRLQPASPLPGPSPYSGPTRGLTERREPESRPVSPESRSASPVRPVRAGRVSRPRLPPVPGTHSMTQRPSTAPQRVPLPSPPASSLLDGPDLEFDSLRAASPTITRFLATAVTDPLFESFAASALVAELVDFAAACRLNYAASLGAESASASVYPPYVGGECALGTDVLEDRQEDLECFAAASPHLVSMLLAPEGDPDAPDIPTPRSYAEAIEGPYSSQWQAAMDAEMASWKSTGTYVDEVPPPGANIVSGMWIFRVKRPSGSPPAFKARYVARGFIVGVRGVGVPVVGIVVDSAVDGAGRVVPDGPCVDSPVLGPPPPPGDLLMDPVPSRRPLPLSVTPSLSLPSCWDKLSSRAVPCVFLGFPPDAPGWQFYHPSSRRVLSSQDVTFDELVSYYRLFPYRTASPPPPPLFLAPDPAEPVEVAVDSGAARGADPAGAGTGGADPAGAGTGGAESGGAETGRAEPGGVAPEGTMSGGAEPARVESGGALGVPSRREPLSPQRLREWYSRRCRVADGGAAGAVAAGGAGAARGGAGARAAGGAAGAGAARGAAGAGGATGATGGAGTAGGGAGAGAARAGGGAGAAGGGAGAGATGGAAGAGAAGGAARTGDPQAEGTGSVSAVSRGAARPRPYYVPLLQQVLGSPPSPGAPPPSLSPPPVPSQSQLQPASLLPGPSPYSGPTKGLTERREPESRPVSPASRSTSPVRSVRAGRVSRPRLPPVPGTHSMTLRPSTAPQRVPLPSPPASSLSDGPDPESDSLRAASPTVTRFLATAFTDPLFEFSAASALVAELVDFAAACRLDYAASLVAESASVSVCPPSVGGECALGTDVLEDRQEDLECFAAASPHLVSMLLAPEGDPDALDIPTPCSYAEAIEGTYVDEVPPPGANIVSGMWIFRHSLPKGQPVYGLRQSPREWNDTLRATLAALGFAPSTADPSLFLRTDATLPPFYILVYVDDLVFATADTEALTHVKSELQKRHTCTDLGELTSYLGLRITRDRAQRTITLTQSHMVQQVLQCFGFTYSSPQSIPLHTGHSLSAPPSDESVEPSGPYPELVGCLITSGMGLVLGGRARVVLTGHADASWVDDLATQRSSLGYTFSLGPGSVSWRSTRSSSVLSSSCEAEIYAGAMAAQELRWLTYLLTDLGEACRSPSVLYVDNKAMLALCQEHRLEHRTKHIALRYFLARELQ
ncbi:unnamed protein product [Closterium sp. NIES-53]